MKINLNKAYIFFLLLPFYFPESLYRIGDDEVIQNISLLNRDFFVLIINLIYRFRFFIAVAAIVYMFIEIIWNSKALPSKMTVFLSFCGYTVWTLIATIINEGDIIATVKEIIICIGFLTLISILIKKYSKHLIEVLFFILTGILLLNIIFGMIYQHGIVTGKDSFSTIYYLIGTKNQATPIILQLMLIQSINHVKQNKFKTILDAALIILNVFMMASSTGIICVGVAYLFLFVNKSKISFDDLSDANKIKLIILATILFSLAVVFFDFQKSFSWFLTGVMHKDASLNSRTLIWGKAIIQIKENLIFGYGFGHNVFSHYYAHNLILQLLLTTGLIGLIIYIYFLYRIFKQGIQCSKKAVIAIFIICYIIMNTTEAFITNIWALGTLVIMFNSELLIQKKNNLKIV